MHTRRSAITIIFPLYDLHGVAFLPITNTKEMKASLGVWLLFASFGIKSLTLSSPISSPPFAQKQQGHAYVHFVSLKEQDTYVSQLYAGAAGHKVKKKTVHTFSHACTIEFNARRKHRWLALREGLPCKKKTNLSLLFLLHVRLLRSSQFSTPSFLGSLPLRERHKYCPDSLNLHVVMPNSRVHTTTSHARPRICSVMHWPTRRHLIYLSHLCFVATMPLWRL